MADSFFTARNQVDPQVTHASTLFCVDLIDAATRRVAVLEGPLEASKRLQRVADICAGAYVLPIDHWKHIEAKSETVPPSQPSRLDRLRLLISDNPAVVFWIGVFVGLYFGGRSA